MKGARWDITPSVLERFWSRIDKGPGCWEWTAGKFKAGYGMFSLGNWPQYAHRLAWFLTTGKHPGSFRVRHTCDNPGCCNPAHLVLGTQADNMRDAAIRGRVRRKLTPEQVVEMRRLSASKEQWGHKRLSKRYGVAKQTVSGIIKRESWRHLPQPFDS